MSDTHTAEKRMNELGFMQRNLIHAFSGFSYPVKFVCTSQSVSKGKHDHFGSELFWAEVTSGISRLQEVKRVGVRVGVAAPET